jgi:aromatic ring-cleaving dioxygenase
MEKITLRKSYYHAHIYFDGEPLNAADELCRKVSKVFN